MNRWLAALTAFVAVVAGWAAPVAAAPAPMVRAVVVLRAQADPAAVVEPGRRRHAAAVERQLRAHAEAGQRQLLRRLDRYRRDGSVTRIEPLWIFSGVAVTATPAVLRALAARPDVRAVQPDLTIAAPSTASCPGPCRAGSTTAATVAAEANIARINAPAMWALGLRGQGTVVANLDTGVDAGHPDLAGRWRGGTNSWFDPSGEHPVTPTDVSGHGTATMGLLVGGDAGGTAIGVAPDATWIAAKIFNDSGTATSTGIHRAMQWLLDPDGDPSTSDAPDVVNNSWTLSTGGCNLDFQLDLRNLRQAGILPVFSAGNNGPAPGTVLSPANNPEALAIGSVDASDTVDPSSGRGPSACGGVAPRLVAPGVGVRSTDLYGLYTTGSGTSLAAPQAAGALALLLCALPDTSADRQAAALEHGAADLGTPGPDNDAGAGRLDALAAYQWLASAPDFSLTTTPSWASTAAGGTARYTIGLTRANGFTGPVALSLGGMTAGQGGWSFSPATLGPGQTTAQLTVTTAATLPGGTYSFQVTGVSGQTSRGTYAGLLVPDFAVTAAPASRTVSVGGATTYSVAVAGLGGFTGPVALTVGGLPAGATVTWSRNPVTPGGSAVLTVRTSGSTPRGTSTVRITGTNAALTHQAVVTFVVR